MSDETDTLDLPDLEADGVLTPNISVGEAAGLGRSASDLAAVFDVPVHVKAILGRASMDVAALLELTSGSLIELDRKVGEAIDILINDRLVARGELVVVDNLLGVTMTEIIKDGDAAN